MERIFAPIGRDSARMAIATLQEALLALLPRGAIAADPAEASSLAALIARERGRYGDGTAKAVAIFQDRSGLEATAEVDEPTAAALNARLAGLGLLEHEGGAFVDAPLAVTVLVEDARGAPAGGVGVALFHRSKTAPDLPLGKPGVTGDDGLATIAFRRTDYAQAGTAGPDLALRLARDGVVLAHRIEGVDGEVIPDFIPGRKPLVLHLIAGEALSGHLLDMAGGGIEGTTLRLYRLEFGGKATMLAQAQSGRSGAFLLAHDPGPGAPVLEIRGLAPDGTEVALSHPLSGLEAGDRAHVDLVAPPELQPPPPEYRRLADDLGTRIGGIAALAGARESDGRNDLTILSRATGWDARLLATAARSERLAADPEIGVGAEPLYALLRAGLPAGKEDLARVPPAAAAAALETARKAGVVQLSDAEGKAALEALAVFSRQTRLAAPAPGGGSSYRSLIAASGLETPLQERFADALLALPAGGDIWAAAGSAGLDDRQIGRLRLQGKLALLAGNSAPLVARLMGEAGDSPRELVAQGLHAGPGWTARILDAAEVPPAERENPDAAALARIDAVIPAGYLGDNALERMAAFGADMARRIRIAYPTEVLAEKVASGSLTAPGAAGPVAGLLRAAAGRGFVMGETPVTTFLSGQPDLVDGLAPDQRALAGAELRTLQRLHQITPEDDAIPVLRAMGMTSAQDVVAMSETSFASAFRAKWRDIYAADIGWAVARLVHRKAQQVSSVVYSLFATAQKITTQPAIAGLSAPPAVVEAARSELLRHVPTLEALFGSLDFGECAHCQSVLGPAAYLVDILQMTDTAPAVWANFVAQWEARTGAPYPHRRPDGAPMTPYDVLIQRRPDLPHVQLSCENTETAMPYIDIVNEIMEYFVAHGRLAAQAARDGEGADSATLLAEPQHVIAQAYAALAEARYPLRLPYDQPLDLARALLERMGVPLAELLDIFRLSEALFDPAAPYDRAGIFLETLGLAPAEIAIFTDPAPLAGWFRLYGFDAAAPALTEAVDAETGQRIDLNSAKALSRRLGTSYGELARIVQTGFVNPELGRLALLYKLGISIGAARSYVTHKALLEVDPAALSPADRLLREDAAAVAERIATLAAQHGSDPAALEAAIAAMPFGRVLVLADQDAGASFDRTLLRLADGSPAGAIDFLRINLLVRLWRKLGWSLTETDRALTTFIPANAPYDAANAARQPLLGALVQIAHVAALERRLKPGRLGRLPLLAFWSDLATTGADSPYAKLFLSPAVLALDPVFDAPLGDYLSPAARDLHGAAHVFAAEIAGVAPADALDPLAFAADPRVGVTHDPLTRVQRLTFRGLMGPAERAGVAALSASGLMGPLLDQIAAQAARWHRIAGHGLAIQGALGLTAGDIAAILADADLTPDTAELSLATLSRLYRAGLLARLLRLPVADMLALKRLTGIDPFLPLSPEPLADLAGDRPLSAMIAFLDALDALKAAGLDLPGIEALLLHRIPPETEAAGHAARTAMLRDLTQRLRLVRAACAIPTDPALFTDAVMAEKLGLALSADVAARFLAMLGGTAEVTVTRAVAAGAQIDPAAIPAGPILAGLVWDAVRQEQRLTLRGVLSDAEKASLLAEEGARLSAPAQATFAALLDDAQAAGTAEAGAFLTAHLGVQALDPAVASGFLDPADFPLMFLRPDPGLDAAAREARDHLRRARIASRFLPFLEARLTRQAIDETLSAWLPAAPGLAVALAADARLLALAPDRPLSATLAGVVDGGLTLTVAGAGAITLPGGDTGARDGAGIRLRPAGDALTLAGFFEVPASGAWRLIVALDKAGARAELRLPDLSAARPVILSGSAPADGALLGTAAGEYVTLEAGRVYRIELALENLGGGEAHLLVQGESLPRSPIGRLALTPAAARDAAEAAAILLAKVVALAVDLGLDRGDLEHLLTHAADFGGLTLSDLPTAPLADSPAQRAAATARLGRLLTLCMHAAAKAGIAGGSDALLTLFQAETGGAADRHERVIYPLLARLTGRSEAEVGATARALWPAPTFRNHAPVLRLARALQAVGRLGAAPGDLVAWTGIAAHATLFARRFDLARGLREAVRARLDNEAWARLARPVFDRLRQGQRDALAAHVGQMLGLATLEQLYEYFLIDPGMEPVVQTSRIRLAIGSVQLFIQRCLMNLEPQVPPSAIEAREWEWMKRYRVWEANRKIFLFPENWLEPEFRDDKSPLFTELEGALLADDVTADMVEDAFLTYLRKLDMIARLDIVAMHVEDSHDPANRVIHVIGRSWGQPHAYHYRRLANDMWGPWTPITVDIAGDHLAPVFWRGRLYLFWVTFRDEADTNSAGPAPANGDTTLGAAKIKDVMSTILGQNLGRRRVSVDLHWAEYSQGSWTQPEGSPPGAGITVAVSADFSPQSTFIHVSCEGIGDEEGGVFIHLGGQINRAFYLAGRNSPVTVATRAPTPANPFSAGTELAGRFGGTGPLRVAVPDRKTVEGATTTTLSVETILGQTPGPFTLLPLNSRLLPWGVPADAAAGAANPGAVAAELDEALADIVTLARPVFYQDARATFFLRPEVSETTVEEWEEWVQPPVWGGEVGDGGMLGDLPRLQVDPGRFRHMAERPFSRIDPRVDPRPVDWLLNTHTAVAYDGVLLGPAGQLGTAVIQAAAPAPGQGRQVPIATATGSAIAAESKVLAAAGLSAGVGGLNVVGAGGFNRLLNRNLKDTAAAKARDLSGI